MPLSTPWLDEDPFPEVPTPGTYGYLDGKKAKIANPEELTTLLGKATTTKIALAWTPTDRRMRPLFLIPLYETAWIEREQRVIRERAKVGWFVVGIMFLGMFASWNDGLRWGMVLVIAAFGVLPIALAWWARRELDDDIRKGFATRYSDERFGSWLRRRKAPLSNWMPGGLFLLFLIPLLAPLIFDGESSIMLAALDRGALRAGEWWRALTVAGVHAGFYHIAMNAGAAAALLSMLERLTHRGTVALTYLAAVLAGSLASSLVYSSGLAVGASGGIMGLAGLLLAYAQRHREVLPHRLRRDAMLNLILTGLLGVIAWGIIDNAAHAGGALAGRLLGRWIDLPAPAAPRDDHPALRYAGAAATGVILFSWGLTAWLVWPR